MPPCISKERGGASNEKECRIQNMDKQIILDTISDIVTDFLFYDRKEDEELPVGKIEECIKAGEITVKEIVDYFESCLKEKIAE